MRRAFWTGDFNKAFGGNQRWPVHYCAAEQIPCPWCRIRLRLVGWSQCDEGDFGDPVVADAALDWLLEKDYVDVFYDDE